MSFFPALLSLLTGGLFATLFRVPYWEIGSRFYKLVTYICLTGWALILLMMNPVAWYEWVIFSLVFALTLAGFTHLWALKTVRHTIRSVSYWCGVTMVFWTFLAFSIWPPGYSILSYELPVMVRFIQFTLSAGILGSVINAMICGHWYLVNKYLSLVPIETISRTLNVLILTKLLIVSLVLLFVYVESFELLKQVILFYPVLVGVRVLAGLLFGWLLNWMAWKTLEHENTQAATGILYACITFIIMGEFSAYYLTLQTGIAF